MRGSKGNLKILFIFRVIIAKQSHILISVLSLFSCHGIEDILPFHYVINVIKGGG
jgi:hypothetical protein